MGPEDDRVRFDLHLDIGKLAVVVLMMIYPTFVHGQHKVPLPGFQLQGRETLLLEPDAPHWGNGIDCSSCHVVHQSLDVQLTNLLGNANLCMSCHNPAGVASNKPFSEADRAEPGVSGTSHNWEVPAENPAYGAAPPTDPEMALRVYDDSIVCSTCHNQHKQTFPPFLRAANDHNALCKDCHAVRDIGSYRDDPANKGSHPVGLAYPTSDPRFYNPPQNPSLPLVEPDRVECTTCHSPHFADSGGANGGAGDGYILRVANDDALCQSCHTYPEHMGQGCRQCHRPHDPDSTNIFLVNGTVATPNSGNKSVAFVAETGLNSFADGNSTYNGVCEVCHTGTIHHRNNSSGDHHHQAQSNCTTCHPHEDAFMPPPCNVCHDKPQDNGDNIPPGGRRAVIAELGATSHHLHGSSLDTDDCRVCHEMSKHMDGRVRLLDRDNPQIVYELTNRPMEDAAEAAKLVPFCMNCHDSDGDVPFSDGRTPPYIASSLWNAAAHKRGGSAGMPLSCIGDGVNFGCHATGHGSDNIKMLNAGSGVSLDNFCFNCHTQGRITNNAISGGGLANDIEQAFSMSRKHDLGTSFTVGNKTFTLQCTTCHNPHIVTGKHWEVASGVSPVTRPKLDADPATNPRAMGKSLWGAVSGQKMNDFAAKGSGTGGWKYAMYRGVPFGSTSIPADQPAVYQPPKKGSGYNFEFDGNKLPDYPTLCLDCHTNRIGSHPPVNWGQGVSCTDNSVDPPSQRVECGAQHGLKPANVPYYSSDPGWWGNNGNPDPIFNQDGVTRGRGYGHFMRWPYESADRNAGINFVMSCTDCHEAHGSNIGSMLRTNPNNGTGSTIWNTMCNNCHYYYGGQHAGMSCGNASCHEDNSIHRIIHVTHSNSKFLWTPPGVPAIVEVDGASGSDKLDVTFSEGVYASENQSGSLQPNDFVLTDNDNGRSIVGVSHAAGASTAVLTLSSAMDVADDINVDQLAAASVAIFDDLGIPMQTGAVTITGAVCPEGTVRFPLNEPAGSATATDEQNVLEGVVNGAGAFAGDGYFHGDGSSTYIDFENNDECLQASTKMTLEVRIKPYGLEGTDNYVRRIFARDRGGNFQLSVWRNNSWETYNAPADTASIAFWVKPTDAHGGTVWKPVLTDYENYPIVSGHWYKIKVVWNSSKSGGIPGDIYVDDQGPAGDDAGEYWSGYANATDSDQSQLPANRYLYEGDRISPADGDFTIGCNVNNHAKNVFHGLIDWITWKPTAN